MEKKEKSTVTLPNGVVLNEAMMKQLKEWDVGKGEEYSIDGYMKLITEAVEILSKNAPYCCNSDKARERMLNLLCDLSILKGDLRSFLYQ